MKNDARTLLLAAALALSPTAATACLWDSDTLAAESARFPGISQLITGAFPRHSQEFYEWRRKTCEQQLAKNPALIALYDDLSVAQHKLGDHKAAIATMLAKEKLKPGVYETYSNLGTFYIYTGELEEAIKWISKALAINPNAHFGREKYQKWLVEWQIDLKKPRGENDSQPQPRLSPHNTLMGFARFVASKESGMDTMSYDSDLALSPEQALAAIRGVSGMMRFADFDNPLLQEAMGDLLLVGELKRNAAQLASICYMQAAQQSTDDEKKAAMQAKCKMAGRFTPDFSMDLVKSQLLYGLKEGNSYFQTIREDEMNWIAAGLDASAEFQKKYLAAR
ncbi:tetratricopeptide repeat protein [Prosthecobacter vanneervenii]|uniref:Tetratricopeptide (TPR) repeat protein n=1 Tax=Prosthecobacter vanneervenii TaxID=48466 RepID=A0A7W7YBB0_9BACT|nr:tetratricopeptide repeat protein [Prosthecobacter vanneervenii]MBB5033028.1 tetratricopeptide (TPR) repeat protein [Prosthecobacter vanneervenii]